jgi:SAM-dependent methyltransferase
MTFWQVTMLKSGSTPYADKWKSADCIEFETLGEKPRFPSDTDAIQLILDVGCGTKPKGTVNVDVVRPDFTEQLGDRVNGKRMSAGDINNFVLAHGEHLPFRDEAFDVVYSSHVIEQTRKPLSMFSEMCRLARRKVIIKCPHRKGSKAKGPYNLNYFDENYFKQASRLLGLKASSFINLFDNPISSKIELFLPQKLEPFIAKTPVWRVLKKLERTVISKGILAFPCEMEVWINKNQQSSNCDNLVFVVCYNIPYLYEARFLSSPYTSNATIESKYNTVAKNESLPVVFNRVINKYVNENVWMIFCHQDFILKEDLKAKMAGKVPGVYGVIGASYGDPTFMGQIIRGNGTPRGKRLKKILPVQTLDEVCIIVHSSLFREGLRFDEQFDFHFYGADLCMEAYRRGFEVYAMQLNCQHRGALYKRKALIGSRGSDSFRYCLKCFEAKWKNFRPIRTTTKMMP